MEQKNIQANIKEKKYLVGIQIYKHIGPNSNNMLNEPIPLPTNCIKLAAARSRTQELRVGFSLADSTDTFYNLTISSQCIFTSLWLHSQHSVWIRIKSDLFFLSLQTWKTKQLLLIILWNVVFEWFIWCENSPTSSYSAQSCCETVTEIN